MLYEVITDIGPKTYAKIFELMLRLRANTIWPAMHGCTKARITSYNVCYTKLLRVIGLIVFSATPATDESLTFLILR